MALEIQRRVTELVANVLGGEARDDTPEFLLRPGRVECGAEWDTVCRIYTELTGQELPEVMRPVERRNVDAVIYAPGCKPFVLEVDEKQHFNGFRAATLTYYMNRRLGFDAAIWIEASRSKKKLESGGFAKPKPPLFPGENGRHRQRAFRDALCDLLPPLYDWGATLRVADFEVEGWLYAPDAGDRMRNLIQSRVEKT